MRDGSIPCLRYGILNEVELRFEVIIVPRVVREGKISKQDSDSNAHWISSGAIIHKRRDISGFVVDYPVQLSVNIRFEDMKDLHLCNGDGIVRLIERAWRRERSGSIDREIRKVEF